MVLEDVRIRKQPVVFRIEFGYVLYCNAEMPFMLGRKESLAGQLWLPLSRRIFEPTAYLCYLGVSGHRQELTLPTMRICFSLVRQGSTFMGIFLLLPSHLPKIICLGEGTLIHYILLCEITISPIFHHCHFDFFPLHPYFLKLSRAVRLKHVHILPLQNNVASVAHINV